jgi:hypothetical protein
MRPLQGSSGSLQVGQASTTDWIRRKAVSFDCLCTFPPMHVSLSGESSWTQVTTTSGGLLVFPAGLIPDSQAQSCYDRHSHTAGHGVELYEFQDTLPSGM